MVNRPLLSPHQFLELRSRWVTLIGEYLQNDQDQTLEYWRVEKADSVIIVPIQNQQFLLPPPTYRHGIAMETWDFPGGRVPDGHPPQTVVANILERELGLKYDAVANLTPLNSTGWVVNSSFSNQCLYGFVAHLHPAAKISSDFVGNAFPTTHEGVKQLLNILSCLQCRTVLMEWWLASRLSQSE